MHQQKRECTPGACGRGYNRGDNRGGEAGSEMWLGFRLGKVHLIISSVLVSHWLICALIAIREFAGFKL
jgi:hypothetical protein